MSRYRLFLIAFLYLIVSATYAVAAPLVNISGRQLITDFDGDGEYTPYFIKGVNYSPVPIGRHPSDWGWTDPTLEDNPLNDPLILNRDFALMQSMHVNTIRLWKANDTYEAGSGRFPMRMTSVTLDAAAQYGLKVIPGFWIVTSGSVCVNGSNVFNTPDFRDESIRQDYINRFRIFVRMFKDHSAVLFWAIGNENNFHLDPTDKENISAFYSLIDDMAFAAQDEEGTDARPVAYVNGGLTYIGDPLYRTTDAELPHIGIWGSNAYHYEPTISFGSLFSDYAGISGKPLWISEYGIDAWHTNDPDNPSDGYEDEALQARWVGMLWDELQSNDQVTIGASVMEYSDEWWKPYEWLDNGIHNTTQNHFGTGPLDTNCDGYIDWEPRLPDKFFNEEWWGLMAIEDNGDLPDIMRPRMVVDTLRGRFDPADNASPRMAAVPDFDTDTGAWVTFELNAVDDDGDPLTFYAQLGSGAPLTDIGAELEDRGDGSAEFRWVAVAGSEGETIPVIVRVDDGRGAQDAAMVMLTVRASLEADPVSWHDPVGVDVRTNNLSKTASRGWGNSGAVSSKMVQTNGGINIRADRTDVYRMFGLSTENSDASYGSINYGLLLMRGGKLRVYEQGQYRGSFGSYVVGDRLSVERLGTTVLYKKNGVLFYASLMPSQGPLLADTSLYDIGADIADAMIFGTNGFLENHPPRAYDQDVEIGMNNPLSIRLTADDPDDDDLIFHVDTAPQHGVITGTAQDLIYTPQNGFSGDDAFSFYAHDGLLPSNQATIRITVSDARIPVSWSQAIGVTVNGNTHTKTTTRGWGNAGAASVEVLTGDGAFEFSAQERSTYRMAGLSPSNPDAGYTSIAYAILLMRNGSIRVYESGIYRGSFGLYASGDRFEIRRTGTSLTYARNGVVFFASPVSSTIQLLADTSLYDSGATIQDAYLLMR